jgi:hypothetical protein
MMIPPKGSYEDDSPGEDVLSMVVSQVDLCGTGNGNAAAFKVHQTKELWFCVGLALEQEGIG